jgi:hypothetical protein
MTTAATHINESKRKKEIVLKYRDSGLEEKLSARISRLNMVNPDCGFEIQFSV